MKKKLPWRETYKYLEGHLKAIDSMPNRNVCPVSIKGDGNQCNCKKKRPFEFKDQIYYEPPNPILSGQIAPCTFQQTRVYFWIPDLMFSSWIQHLFCPECNHVLKWNGWAENGPRTVQSEFEEYAILTKVCQHIIIDLLL